MSAWYRTVRRWAQTNLTEVDPERYDSAVWEAQWQRTQVDAVIVNAGGVVAYYPTDITSHTRARRLAGRDLLAEVVSSARSAGLALVARMDSSRVSPEAAAAHPDWLARRSDGSPHRIGHLFAVCVNSSYYHQHLPAVLAEVIGRYQPDGIADNSWSGLGRHAICYCEACRARFRTGAGGDLPRSAAASPEGYLRWYRWNQERREEIWAENQQVVQELGGPDHLWLGMLPAAVSAQVDRFLDVRRLVRDRPLVLLDHQSRGLGRFEDNAETGLRLHELLPEGARVAESMAMYKAGSPVFRLTSMPAAESRLWASAAFAGGIDPWWHHIGAEQQDRRQLDTAAPVFRWHAQYDGRLQDRHPVAEVAVLWSEQNTLVSGWDDPQERTERPRAGVLRALQDARIPAVSVHVDDLSAQAHRFRTIILPQLEVLTQDQEAAVSAFLAAGGSVVASGPVGGLDLHRNPAERRGLTAALGVTDLGTTEGDTGPHPSDFENPQRHTYLRKRSPAGCPDAAVLWDQFGDTDLVPFGGQVRHIRPHPGSVVIAEALPPVGVYPPETAWLPHEASGTPAIVVRESCGGHGRTVYLAADLDRCAGRDGLVDHRLLLGNLIRWTLPAPPAVILHGPGDVDLRPYRQRAGWIVHLQDASRSEAPVGTVDRLWALGPYRLGIEDPRAVLSRARSLTDDRELETIHEGGRIWVDLPALTGHGVVLVQ